LRLSARNAVRSVSTLRWWRSAVNRSFFLCLAACRTRLSAWVTRFRLCVRCVLCWSAFPLAPALGSTASAAVTPIVPKPLTSGAKADGRFGKQDFIYQPETDTYRCPAGEQLIWRFTTVENGLKLSRYWSSNCGTCAMKAKCTPSKQRRITRWEHEAVIEVMQRRLDEMPNAMRVRRSIVEHVFGTIKDWMGRGHFLTRKLANVATEMSLHVLAYNLKRAVAVFGASALMAAIRE